MHDVERACSDCGKPAPAESGDSTLISTKYGWRLVRERAMDGTLETRWRCPACWRAHKERTGAVPSSRPPEPSAGSVFARVSAALRRLGGR